MNAKSLDIQRKILGVLLKERAEYEYRLSDSEPEFLKEVIEALKKGRRSRVYS